ncbi:hypothetical protein [Acinetobacter stercoris]|uniref:Uncharacterized protein n=1 Tax=Acinetobacter stercoris TaxID=2126983 RepID=A0A2U3MY84_9GAMM|nr:hypothetical protein [Acinetobacter stercoris]SPL70269.1 hypothetical protein KPC_1447 [Acinetobacter stercoris]
MNYKLITYLKTNLDVSREDITDSLMMAPIYTASIAYPLVCLSIIIGENFTVESFESIITAPIFFIIVLLIYFVFVYVFAYISQTFLLRKKRLNFFTIMASAFLIIILYSSILSWNVSASGAVIMLFSIFAIPIVITYWVLLFKVHRKNSK